MIKQYFLFLYFESIKNDKEKFIFKQHSLIVLQQNNFLSIDKLVSKL